MLRSGMTVIDHRGPTMLRERNGAHPWMWVGNPIRPDGTVDEDHERIINTRKPLATPTADGARMLLLPDASNT